MDQKMHKITLFWAFPQLLQKKCIQKYIWIQMIFVAICAINFASHCRRCIYQGQKFWAFKVAKEGNWCTTFHTRCHLWPWRAQIDNPYGSIHMHFLWNSSLCPLSIRTNWRKEKFFRGFSSNLKVINRNLRSIIKLANCKILVLFSVNFQSNFGLFVVFYAYYLKITFSHF